MADFRRVALSSLKWFPQSRKTVPVTPVKVQVPPCPCTISLLPGRYGIELTLAGHAAHAEFVRFLVNLEAHARENARPSAQGLSWYSCVDAHCLVPSLRIGAFDDTRFYGEHGQPHTSPTDFASCSCLLELAGAWTTDAHWGLRWKVLEVKKALHMGVPCLLVPDD